jgi:transposase-like protein
MVIRGHGAKMNRLWLPAIRALLTEDTVQAAATRIGVSRNTLSAWMKDKDFASAFEECQKHQQAAMLKRLADENPIGFEPAGTCA